MRDSHGRLAGRIARTAPKLPRWRLNRLIFALFNAEARCVAQDPAGPFCTMKVRTARGFCANLRGSGQTGPLGRFQVGQLERKEEMKAYPPDAESFV
jgi:hypothetical protein